VHTYKFTIPAGGSVRAEIRAKFLRCMASTSEFTLVINDASRLEGFGVGLSFEASGADLINDVRIENPSSTTPLTVSIYAGAGQVEDARLSLVAGAAITSRPASRWNEFIKTPPEGANVEAIGADPDRLELICYNNGTGDFWLRQAVTESGGGIFLAPGASVVLTLSAAVRIYNPGPATAFAHFVEMLR
jgi:hypothetical protein